MSFSDHKTLQWVWIEYNKQIAPHWYHGDTYEVDPKLSGGFEL